MKTNNLYDTVSAEAIRDYLLHHDLTLSVAESVTSGHLQAAFSAIENTGLFFQGGITVYNLGQKVRHLNIEPIHAETCNCVSEQTAVEMALGVTRMFTSTVGISITGYATPDPQKGISDIFAWYAVVKGNDVLLSKKITSAKKEMTEVQLDYTAQVLYGTKEVLLSLER